MRKLLLIMLMGSFMVPLNSQKGSVLQSAKSPRTEKIINSNWTFNYFADEKSDKGYEASDFDDSKWPAISIPHTWSTFETTGEVHPFIMSAAESDNPYWWNGWGWYRKHFTINSARAGQKVIVEFEGVQKYCKVWINGKYLGDHKGGYGSFDFDMTEFIIPGKDNVLAVAVNNTQKDRFRIPPMAAGNFDVYGGIYRDVTIVLKDMLHIPMQGSASHEGGTFVTTPRVSEKEGIVRIQTWVQNDYPKPKECLLNTYIIDALGKTVQVLKSKFTINPKQLYKFDQTSKPVIKPRLWSPDAPYLYKIYSEVTDGSRVTDSYTSPLGFRWFRWDYKENFLYVNGRKVIIQGGNRHQEYPWLGDAIPKWITEMDFADIAENLDYNFIRTAHYPNDKMVYDLADKYGIVVDEESPSIKNQEFSAEVQEQQMKEMIRRDRNHPSIMIWSMGNETDHAVDSRFAAAEDTTRILTARRVSNSSAGTYVRHNDDNLHIENLLHCTVRGWYNEDIKNLEPSDPQHCGTEEHQQNMLKQSGLFGTGNLCTWIYEDHGADREYLNSPLLHVNPKGFVDVYRIPKYAYYFWQATYAENPMVFIQPHYWRTQYLGQKKDIVVNSNCDKIELKVNGISKGSITPAGPDFHSVTFRDISIENGTITALGTRDGKSVSTNITMAGEPAKIVLKSSHQKIGADRASVVIITADIVDSKGNHVYGASNTVKWSIAGPATLAGPSVYESDIEKHHEMEGVWYMDMPVSNVIRSTGNPGKISISASASGLASGSVEIEAFVVPADNTAISEPLLSVEGRKRVSRPELDLFTLEEEPGEMKTTTEKLNLGTRRIGDYAKSVSEIIYKYNPATDTSTIEYKALASLLAKHLFGNNGVLIADDYNYNIGHYNSCRLISGYINPLKLPPLFKEWLKRYYADEIILRGNEKNAGDEMNWLNWIPSGGTVVVSQAGKVPLWPKGTITTPKSNLEELISTVHPVFANYSDEARERALIFISKMNPYIRIARISTIKDGKAVTEITYTAEQERPILIPLIKFITD
jgi:beta-galactosidase